jgi:branched-subunit amino acid aminotransferase/4-amino-4-deoxychorismate lyase
MFWLNGKPAETIPLDDRGLHYGDGCFTTARCVQGKIDHLEAHLNRMQTACEQLLIGNVNWTVWRDEFLFVARSAGMALLKLSLLAGVEAAVILLREPISQDAFSLTARCRRNIPNGSRMVSHSRLAQSV